MVFHACPYVLINPKGLWIVVVIHMVADRTIPRASLFNAKKVGVVSGKSGRAEAALESHLCKSDGCGYTIFYLLFYGYHRMLLIKSLLVYCHVINLCCVQGRQDISLGT